VCIDDGYGRLTAVLAELHLHLFGCVRPRDLLRHMASRAEVRWDLYEAGMRAAYGTVPPARRVVERFRRGDVTATDDFEDMYVFGDEDAGSFDRFQAKSNLMALGLALNDPAAGPAEVAAEMAEIAAGVRADHLRNGISYAEHRVLFGVDPDTPRNRAVLNTLLDVYHRGDAGVVERLAVSLNRTNPWPAWALVQDLALGPYGSVVTGIDFCNIEEGHPPNDAAALFRAAQDFNAAHPERALAILYHVGESFHDKSLESAVRWVQEAAEFGAHRLGHAIALGIDPYVFGSHSRKELVSERRDQIAYDLEHRVGLRAAGVAVSPEALRAELADLAKLPDGASLTVTYDSVRLDEVGRRQRYAMQCIRSTGAVIEVCPTSNRRIGGITDPAHHPVHRFLAAGLPVVVSSDDPGNFATTLNVELDWVCEHTGGGADLRHELIETAWNSRSELLSGRMKR
jgi:adenosine deaminase